MGIRPNFTLHDVTLQDTDFRPEGGFDSVVHGYDRRQVNRYATRIERFLTEMAARYGRSLARERELGDQVAQLKADILAERREKAVEQLPPSRHMAGRMERMLSASEQLAGELNEQALADADAIRAQGQVDADALRAQAEQDAEQIRARARAEAEAIVADAQRRADPLIALRARIRQEIAAIQHVVERLARVSERPREELQPRDPRWPINNAPRTAPRPRDAAREPARDSARETAETA